MKADEPRQNRIPFMMSDAELAAVDDWRFANKIATRAEAIRRLCQVGLLIDGQLEELLDFVTRGVEITSKHNAELSAVFRGVINRDTQDMTFTSDQLWDVFTLAREQADVSEEGLRGLHHVVLTIYNAVAAIVDAKTTSSGVTNSEGVIAAANAAVDEADRRKAERERQSEDNRYLAIHLSNQSHEERATYEALSEEEQNEYLDRKIEQLELEEAKDPVAFAKRYGIDSRKFWEKPAWTELLESIRDRKKSEG